MARGHAGSLSTTASPAVSERQARSQPAQPDELSFFKDGSFGIMRPTQTTCFAVAVTA